MKTMLSEDLKNKWVAALRSGKYEQGKGFLRRLDEKDSNKEKFCCLGVLCDVFDPELWDRDAESTEEFSSFMFKEPISTANIFYFMKEGSEVLSYDLAKSFGFHEGALSIQDILTEMNDRDNKSFSEIADWIEENL